MPDVEGLLGSGAVVRCAALPIDDAWLFPEERALVEAAVPKRRAEFAAARHLARAAMAELGVAPAPILAGEGREPVWPPGIVGSISHDASCCLVAVAREADGYRSLGIDTELAGELDSDLVETVCRPDELEAAVAGKATLGETAKRLFSAKESVFKCQFPLTREWLDFNDLRVALESGGEGFSATLLRDAGPLRAGHRIDGRMRVSQGHIVSAAWLPSSG